MIKDILFVGKMFLLTIFVVVVMQVHIGEKSVEDHFHGWLKKSVAVDYIEEAIDGGKILFQSAYKKVDSGIHSLLAKTTRHHEKKERGLNFSFKRHTDTESDDDLDMILPKAQTAPSKIH